MKKSIFKKWTIIPLVLLFSTIIYKLIKLSFLINKNLNQFIVDFSTNFSRLYLLIQYGFHEWVPLWFNGFKLFQYYPPGWYYFTLPIVYLTNNIFIATYISIIILFILNFFLIYLLGKREKMSRNKILLFYTFLFGNAWFLTNITDLGRISDLFAWSCFLSLSILIYYYKTNRIDKYFILFILFSSLLLLAHIYYFIIGCILISCLFFYKPIKEKIIIFLGMIIALIITSFWWKGFITIIKGDGNQSWIILMELMDIHSLISLNTIALALFLIMFLFYIPSVKNKRKELLFYFPIIITWILLLTRIMVVIPIFNRVPVSAYNFLFIFLSLFLFFKINWKNYPKLKNIILIFVIIFSMANILLVIHFTQTPEYSPLLKEAIESLEFIDGKYVVLKGEYGFSFKPIVAYATVYYNLTTIQGIYPQAGREILEKVRKTNEFLINKQCNFLKEDLLKLGVENIISFKDDCLTLKECGFSQIQQTENVCVYETK